MATGTISKGFSPYKRTKGVVFIQVNGGESGDTVVVVVMDNDIVGEEASSGEYAGGDTDIVGAYDIVIDSDDSASVGVAAS